ncbi:hypothetical protein JCM8097_006676 [Rhodosporidiobolus ruineniae]
MRASPLLLLAGVLAVAPLLTSAFPLPFPPANLALLLPRQQQSVSGSTAATLTSIESTSMAAPSTALSTGEQATPTASDGVPFYSAPNSFTPTATGSSPLAGSVITITNAAPTASGATADVFTYTAALSTVPPTGNITNPAVAAESGGAGGTTDLAANPTHLQIARAGRLGVPGGCAGFGVTVLVVAFGLGWVAVLG